MFVCVCVKNGDSAFVLGMKYGSHENISFLIDDKRVRLEKEVFDDAISRAKEFGVPSIVLRLLRRKVCFFLFLFAFLSFLIDNVSQKRESK